MDDPSAGQLHGSPVGQMDDPSAGQLHGSPVGQIGWIWRGVFVAGPPFWSVGARPFWLLT
jgi:hypothetical protein